MTIGLDESNDRVDGNEQIVVKVFWFGRMNGSAVVVVPSMIMTLVAMFQEKK